MEKEIEKQNWERERISQGKGYWDEEGNWVGEGN